MTSPSFHGEKKGGGGGSSVAPDNLRSTDAMEVIVGLCEGPIYGLERGPKSFYLNETQYQNEDGTYNFLNAQLAVYTGEPVQGPIAPVLGGTSRSRSVNVQLKPGTPVVRQTVGGRIHAFDVRLVVNQLYQADHPERGDVTAQVQIEWKEPAQTEWNPPTVVTITGKTTASPFVREVRTSGVFDDPGADDRPNVLEIKITLLTEPTEQETINITWESFQEIQIEPPKSYPNTAIAHFFATASNQFSSVPELGGVYRGMIVQVPSNYDPINRTYTGLWDGSFRAEWTDNPAWILYDLVMNDRYGLNHYGPVVIDKWDCYTAGQWCDQFVPKVTVDINGQVAEIPDKVEPRFTFNGVLSDSRSAWDWVRYIAGSFFGVMYDDLGGVLRLCVPAEDDPVAAFANESVADGVFNYTFTDINTRYNDGTVTFINPEMNWLEDRRRVIDLAAVERNGSVPLDMDAVGCIYESEAIRRLKYRLDMARAQTTTVTFRTNRRGTFVRPYDRIEIADNHINQHHSGRVIDRNTGATLNPVKLSPTCYVRYNVPGVGLSEPRVVLGRPNAPGTGTLVAPIAHDYTGTPNVDPWVWEFLDTYGVWASENGVAPRWSAGITESMSWEFDCPGEQDYVLTAVVDGQGTVYVDGASVGAVSLDTPLVTSVHLTRGQHTVTVEATNTVTTENNNPKGNPAAAAVSIGHFFHSRMPQREVEVNAVVLAAPPLGSGTLVAPFTPAFADNFLAGAYAVWASDDGVTPRWNPGATEDMTWEFEAAAAGTYDLHFTADDSGTLYLDGVQVAQVMPPSVGVVSTTVTLTAGRHEVRIVATNAAGPEGQTVETNPGYVAAYIPGVWNTRRIQTITSVPYPDTGENPINIIVISQAGILRFWRVLGVTEADGNPDQIEIQAVSDWSAGLLARTERPEGWVPPSEEPPTLPPGDGGVPPDPIASCPTFTMQGNGNIEVAVTGPFHAFSRPAGESAWVQRAVMGQQIVNHPAGAYEFKIVLIGPTGLQASFDLTPICPFTVPNCPPPTGTVTTLGVSLLDASVCPGFDVFITWDTDIDDRALWFDHWAVTIKNADTGATLHTGQVVSDRAYVWATPTQPNPRPARITVTVEAVNACGARWGAATITRDYRWCIQQPCTTWDQPVLKGTTEVVKTVPNATGAVTIDVAQANNWVLMLSGNVTITLTGGCGDGKPAKVLTVQPATGNKTVTFSGVKWRKRRAVAATATPGAVDKYVLFHYPGIGWVGGDAGRNFGEPA